MRRLILILNVAVVVFGVAAAIISLSNGIIAAICGVVAALATGASLVLGAWETYLDTPYGGIRLEGHEPILFTPRRGLPGPNGIPTEEKANFWKWLFGKR
jgi:hypothetical protein